MQEGTRKCLWISVCNCVSLQCPLPVSITACTGFSRLLFCWLGICLRLTRSEVTKHGFYEKQLLHSTVSQTLAQHYENDIHSYFHCHWCCVHWMEFILEKPSFWWCWDRRQWLLYWLLLNERCRTNQEKYDLKSTQNSCTNWKKISWSLVQKLSSACAKHLCLPGLLCVIMLGSSP